MKAIFEKINDMQAVGIIGKYAIGDAVGATFYLEPSATIDVDIFSAKLPAPFVVKFDHEWCQWSPLATGSLVQLYYGYENCGLYS